MSSPTDARLSAEQTYVSEVYRRLDELRDQTRRRLDEVRRSGANGTHQNRSERDAFATLYEDRLALLESVEERLVFGRLDLLEGDLRYIGRVGLSDADHHPLLTDWRAPAARPFYQATAAHPQGVTLRRHIQTRGRDVVGIEDDVLDLDAVDNPSDLAGEGALLAALAEHRTGRMGDIVATIQAEQDAIIRSDVDGVLVVQGGPGTGKTAVALHRAAYLLYAHRERMERSGVLVVGPSPVFLRYIEQVLPALGETGVVSMTIADLVPGVSVTAAESDELATIKGKPIWQRIISRAVRARQRVLPRQELKVGSVSLTLRPEDVRTAHTRARRTGQPHNQARVTFVRVMLRFLAEQYAEAVEGVSEEEIPEIIDDIRSSRDVRVALNLCWLPLTATGLVADLFAKPHRLAEAGRELGEGTRALLYREPDAGWTEADIPLIDEAAELIGSDDATARAQARAEEARRSADVDYARQMLENTGLGGGIVTAEMVAERFADRGPALTLAERALADRSWTYGHVVIDEAQELSAMAWRALLRRNPTRSMTIVGDVSQVSTSAGTRRWAETLDKRIKGSWRLETLTVNYRTPATVMDAAWAVAVAADPSHPPSEITSARDVPDALEVVETSDVGAAVRSAIDAERSAGGNLAVIVPTSSLPSYAAEFGLDVSADLTAPVVILDPARAKGLEFDRVILVEPRRIQAESAGPGDLYVAMTRCTQRLVVVAKSGLPEGLASRH
ncbi:MAG TPA: AAA family ATPase [Beutenbergiaceae bacterium]|nr:AAA family ATPase [Beutenbergiaceae bacterium]